jgi:hypothetical protein
MGVTALVVGAVVVAGMLLLSRVLLKQPSVGDAVRQDDFNSPLSTRGIYLPYVIGEGRVSPIFGWVGQRSTVTENLQGVDAGGGKDFSKPNDLTDLKTTVYYEQGWHLLSLGPCSALTKIYQDGNEIWSGRITPEDTESGTSVDVPGQGSFKIFWGELNQPLAPRALRDGTGVASSWPYVCYVFWDKKRLGPNPKWPILNYVLENSCPREVADISWEAEIDVDGDGKMQANPASALLRLLTAEYPHGAGLVPQALDGDSLSTLGAQMDTELLGCSTVIESGEKLQDVLELLLMDIGVAIPYLGDGLIAFNLIRTETGTPPSITADMVREADIETEIRSPSDDQEITQVTFEYVDSARNYRLNEIDFTNDGVANDINVFNPQTARLRLSNSRRVARKIANRRVSEFFGTSPAVKFTGLGEVTRFLPGQRLFDMDGRMIMVLSLQRDPMTSSARIEGVLDATGAAPEDNDDGDDDGPTVDSTAAREDYAFKVFEVPPSRYVGNGVNIEVSVLRLRADETQVGSLIQYEVNGSGEFSALGIQTKSAAGGPIDSTMPATGTTITNGPIFEAANDDVINLPDYRNRPTEHQNGALLMIIGDEVCYPSHVEAIGEVGLWIGSTFYGEGAVIVPENGADHRRYVQVNPGGTSGSSEPDWPSTPGDVVVDGELLWECRHPLYQIKNIIRAQEGTAAQEHIEGDIAYILQPADLRPMTSPGFVSGAVIGIKSLPFTSDDSVPGSIVEAAEITLAGASQFGDQIRPFYENESGDTYINQLGERYVFDAESEE